MATGRASAAAAAVLMGILWGASASPAFAALNQASLEEAELPEMAEAAIGIAGVLEALDPNAEEQEIVGALHEYLASVTYPEDVVAGALVLVFDGEWSDVQLAALRSLFRRYFPDDVLPPGAGADFDGAAGSASTSDLASNLGTVSNGNPAVTSPQGGSDGPNENDDEDMGETHDDPPPGPRAGTGSDYDYDI